MNEQEPAVTAEEIATLLKKSRETIYRLARSGEIPGFKVGGEWRFLPSRVFDHLTATPDPWAQPARARRRAA